MKVILLQDVAKLGRRFDVVNVPDGYGMNKLIPKGMAKPATPENIKRVQAQAAQNDAAKAQVDETFAAAVAAVGDTVIAVTAEANEDGKLFQALKPEVIAEAVAAQVSATILPEQVVIKAPIKHTGEYTMEFSSGETHAPVTINVTAA